MVRWVGVRDLAVSYASVRRRDAVVHAEPQPQSARPHSAQQPAT